MLLLWGGPQGKSNTSGPPTPHSLHLFQSVLLHACEGEVGEDPEQSSEDEEMSDADAMVDEEEEEEEEMENDAEVEA